MHYLISPLEGQALEIVKGVAMSEENYKIVEDALFGRYKSNRSLMFFHIKELFVDMVKRLLQSLIDVEQQTAAILIYLVR